MEKSNNFSEKWITSGKRIKQEMKNRGLSNQAVADLIGYSSGHQISPILSGTKPLSIDRAEILSSAWGVRRDYLLGLDSWKTDDAMLSGQEIKDIEAFKACKGYLESLGLEFRPVSNGFDIDDIGKEKEILPVIEENSLFFLEFKVYKNGVLKGQCSIYELQKFMKHFDAFARCAVDTLLLDGSLYFLENSNF